MKSTRWYRKGIEHHCLFQWRNKKIYIKIVNEKRKKIDREYYYMSVENSINNKRIAKNTLVLYCRTLVVLVVSLYTSRLVLNALGVEDYGTYNVVGGVVAMFSVISGALSSAISRFITFELGKGNKEKLRLIFSSSVNIQVGISLIVLLIGEIVGVWFLNYQMNIPQERLVAANWVLQCSLLTFCINLISIPYNACIIAHERMQAFAYITILEAFLKLTVCILILISPWDKLISYAILLLCVALIIRLIYGIYCHQNFAESHYQLTFDRRVLKEMTGFAGWNFFTNSAYILNTQGVNLLINIFFGVGVNAARGIATQVDHAVMQLVNSFTTALNPQITKSYAAGNMDGMVSLVCRGAKFSYFLLFLLALPILMETEYILTVWLKIVPEHAVNFVRLAIIASLVNIVGKTGYTAAMATGSIRRYVLWVTPVGSMVFPLTWISFFFGAPSESTYIVFIIVYVVVEAVRLWIMKGLLDFPIGLFLEKVIIRILFVTAISLIVPLTIIVCMEPSWERAVLSFVTCIACSIFCTYTLGLSANEKKVIIDIVKKKLHLT